jgi:hypothetical protein
LPLEFYLKDRRKTSSTAVCEDRKVHSVPFWPKSQANSAIRAMKTASVMILRMKIIVLKDRNRAANGPPSDLLTGAQF